MTDEELIRKLTYDVYLTRYNREIDGIDPETWGIVTDADALAEIRKTIAWANMFVDELEREVDSSGVPINWSFVRENDVELGTVTSGMTELELDTDDILRLVIQEERPLTIVFDGSAVSTWDVVNADQITKRSTSGRSDRVAVVGGKILFSRAFKDTEVGGTLVADVIYHIPRLASAEADMIETVKPYQLLVLGVAKNATLPDIVQGGLSPSFVQRYGDLLEAVKLGNQNSSTADELVKEDYGYIGGIY